ncbi:hypothetical protein [Sulfurimonas sp.]|uniref:hypothetical protein n=1 Tax=Sulfurimonas sp. TaxID=2022749 RepID=UPI002AAF9404|nr:hypothetical protein [Sulfurimonas sp.]
MYIIKRIKKILLISIFIVVSGANAGEIDIDVYGLSYHLDATQAYAEAPRRLDSQGQWVFNPGIGVTYDFRDNISEEGFSPIVAVGYFQDCADYPFYFAGAGIRYRNYIDDTNFMWEVNVAGAMLSGVDWDFETRDQYFTPTANIGFGYKLSEDYLIKANFSYIPADDSASGTAGTDLIFMQVSLGF